MKRSTVNEILHKSKQLISVFILKLISVTDEIYDRKQLFQLNLPGNVGWLRRTL